MPKHLTQKQTKVIQSHVKKGYSANQIQLYLKSQHMGIRRKVLLAEVRRFKGQSPKTETVKYIPKKYVKKRWVVRAKRPRLRRLGEKRVVVTGEHCGKLVVKKRFGSGKDLYNFVFDEMRSDFWDDKPKIHS